MRRQTLWYGSPGRKAVDRRLEVSLNLFTAPGGHGRRILELRRDSRESYNDVDGYTKPR